MHHDISLFLEEQLIKNPWFKTKKLLFKSIINNVFDVCYCDGCGKELSIDFVLSGGIVHHYCCSKCGHNSENSKRKRRETNLLKYGTDSVCKLKEVKNKIKQTNLERYGNTCALHSKEISEKVKKTNLERYGNTCALHSKEISEKVKKTNLERYGAEYPLQNKDIHKKQENTMLEKYGDRFSSHIKEFNERRKKTTFDRYGVEYASQNNEIKIKTEEVKRKTNLERYGVENVFQVPEVKEKIKKTNLERYGVENPIYSEQIKEKIFKNNYHRVLNRIKDYVIPLFDEKDYHGWKNDNYGKQYRWKCVKCGCEFEQHFHTTNVADDSFYIPQCPKCFPKNNGVSMEEKSFILFLKEIYNGSIIENSRQIISPMELDVYIPELKIAFEYDGLYWHSDYKKDSKYHLNKTEACEKEGIRLIHIFEDEWIYKREIVKDRIRSILGFNQNRIYARKCTILEIDASVSNDFLEKNHIQGKDASSVRYGLFYKDTLVSVMTFGKSRFNKNYDWELIRFASLLGVTVVGGASKLLTYFKKRHSGSIISYADRRYSNGKLYESIGFIKKENSAPNYFWINGMKRYSRYQCQKHKLASLLGDSFDENLSESENMKLNGYCKIYDCGNIVYTLKQKLDEMAQ